MDRLFFGIMITLTLTLGIFSAGHALLKKRDSRSALGWIVISLTLPLCGPLLYWSMGVNRINLRVRRWLESGQRLAGWDVVQSGLNEEASALLPDELGHLNELRSLSDRVVSSKLLAGNCLQLLENGENAYPAMLMAIRSAGHSVNLSTYIFDGDNTGRLFVAALKEASDRGVEVRVIIDSLGEKYSHPTAARLLKGSQVKVAHFLPLRQGGYINLRNHRKLLVVDGITGFTGGMNIGDRHLTDRSGPPPVVRDIHFRVTGQVVANLQRTFLEDWYFVTRELVSDRSFFPQLFPTGNAFIRAVSDGPDKGRKLNWIILGAISCARKQIQIMTPYFIPDRPLISALVTAALRGVEITLVLPSLNNLPFVQWASRAYLWELLQYGIRIYSQPPPFVHSKLLLVDDAWCLIGSANLDPRSLRLNFEFDLEVYDREFAGLVDGKFAAAVAVSHQVTLEEVDGRSLPVKLRDSTAKLFSPYL